MTWSPDGTYLLYQAWGDGSSNALVAIPADLQGPPVVLSRIEGIVAYEGYPDTTFVPIQAWGTPAVRLSHARADSTPGREAAVAYGLRVWTLPAGRDPAIAWQPAGVDRRHRGRR